MADIKDREVCGSQELIQRLLHPQPHPHALPSCNITLPLDYSRISKTTLCNGPVFMVLQKQENLNQTSDESQEVRGPLGLTGWCNLELALQLSPQTCCPIPRSIWFQATAGCPR